MQNIFRKYWFLWISCLIILLAGALRFYKLADVPHGMTWDEAAIGYNGSAIFRTRRDEWLVKLPTSFRSFGDYKAPFAIYLNGLFTFVFGMNLWAVRLPFALIGVGGVLGMILLCFEFGTWSGWSRNMNKGLALIGGLMLTMSPWHLNFSRAGFESGMVLSFTIWAAYLLFRYFRGEKLKFIWLLGSVFFFVLTFYTYHSAKVVTPLLLLSFLAFFNKHILRNKKEFIAASILGLTGLYPILKDSIYGKGLERASTLIFAKTEGPIEFMWLFLRQMAAHLDPRFLVLGKVTTLRNGDGAWGVLLPVTFLLVICGLFFGLRAVAKQKGKLGTYAFPLMWILIGITPAALGSDLVPHSNRALLALPGFIIFALTGLKGLSDYLKQSELNRKLPGSHGEKNMLWVSVMGTLMFLQLLFFVKYINHYYTNFAKSSADAYSDGYLEAFDYVKELEPNVDKIVFTDEYGQPYIYALFARNTNPIWYQGGSLIKYQFSSVNIGDLERKNAVIVAGENAEFFNPSDADKLVYGSDGEIRFMIFVLP